MTDQPSQAALQEAARRLTEVCKERKPEGVSPMQLLVARLIQKHEPETLLDPVIEARKVKAREIAADYCGKMEWRRRGDIISTGCMDNEPEVQIALAALTFAGWRPET